MAATFYTNFFSLVLVYSHAKTPEIRFSFGSMGFYWIRILAQTLAFDGYLARIRKSNLEKNTFSNDQSYFAFFSKINLNGLTWYWCK